MRQRACSTGGEAFNAGIYSGKVVETWLGFISEDGLELAQSFYTGQLTVLPLVSDEKTGVVAGFFLWEEDA